MILRDYQDEAVTQTVAAIAEGRRALIVMPTGGGKSAVAGEIVRREAQRDPTARFLVLQHTEELIRQNLATISDLSGLHASVVKAAADDWSGACVFASTPTLARAGRLERLPRLTHIIVDEAHRAVTDGVARVIAAVEAINPMVRVIGLTATPDRGDKADLRDVFTEVSYAISLGELIERGILVYPRGFAVDIEGAERLGDDEAAAEDMLNVVPVNDQVVAHWRARAAGRRTLGFCATIDHAEAVAAHFVAAGIPAASITTRTSEKERARILAGLDAGTIQVVTNCTALMEGFDCQPVSCVMLLRPMLKAITFRQAIGRGLRSVDAERYPGEIKTDCVVLDFVGAIQRHGGLEDAFRLGEARERASGERTRRFKPCPGCGTNVPAASRCCPLCDFAFETREKVTLKSFEMIEADLMAASPFVWTEVRPGWHIAAWFGGWAGFFRFDGHWHAIGRREGGRARILCSGTKLQAIAAAGDFLRAFETRASLAEGRRWMNAPATPTQLGYIQALSATAKDPPVLPARPSKYQAMCFIAG